MQHIEAGETGADDHGVEHRANFLRTFLLP
jgi:hypothetical protein